MLVISTGGTLDKYYDPVAGELLVGPPVVKHILLSFSHIEYETLSLIQKDSLDLSDSDRELIIKACKDTNERHILITHGTDTMNETALMLRGSALDKVIILTGSMRPYCIEPTESAVNIGAAIGSIPLLKPGVYISMHGLVLPDSHYVKDRTLGRFISV